MESGKRGLETAWKKALEQIEDEVSEQEFSRGFLGIEYAGGNDSQLQLSVPNSFTKDQLTQRYLPRIEEKLADLAGEDVTVKLSVQRKRSREAADEAPAAQKKAEEAPGRVRRQHPQLNKEYTFERFIIGESNSFAANAALAISRNPGTGYNPCLIYGGGGVGKTHPRQAPRKPRT